MHTKCTLSAHHYLLHCNIIHTNPQIFTCIGNASQRLLTSADTQASNSSPVGQPPVPFEKLVAAFRSALLQCYSGKNHTD